MKRALSIALASILSVTILCGQQAQSGSAASNSTKARAEKKTGTSKPLPSNGAPIDLNTASQAQLESLPGVGAATAKKIIGGRPFTSVGDLKRAGVSTATINKISSLVVVSPPAQTQAPASAPTPSRTEAARPAPVPKVEAPAQGGGNGQVWVNLDSKIYHYQGDRFYGKTKNGKYMTEKEAVQAGYRASKTGVKKSSQ